MLLVMVMIMSHRDPDSYAVGVPTAATGLRMDGLLMF
jgi:hypothetical protein